MVTILSKSELDGGVVNDTEETLVIFDIDSLGIDGASFMADLLPSFATLEWDYYDVRREQLQLINSIIELKGPLSEKAHAFYDEEIGLDQFLAALPLPMPPNILGALEVITPYRRRATTTLRLDRDTDAGWRISKEANEAIVQRVVSSDYRSMARRFSEVSPEITSHRGFERLLRRVGDLVVDAKPKTRAMRVTCWQTGIIATAERPGSNSPEGIHQDGADFIVSALVLERSNISGGTSRVFGPDKKTEIVEVTLQPGQGIFQADAQSTLWHDVTPLRVSTIEGGTGVRNLFGFDIHLLDSAPDEGHTKNEG